jgi:hypothetical protein
MDVGMSPRDIIEQLLKEDPVGAAANLILARTVHVSFYRERQKYLAQ